MTKTTNYNLNQWEAEDQVKREDFNADNAAIDAALAAAAGLAGNCAVYTVTRTGSDTSDWITLTVPKGKPFAVFGTSHNSEVCMAAWRGATTACYIRTGSSDKPTLNMRWGDNYVSWRCSNFITYNLNLSYNTYTYVVLSALE